MLAPWEEAGASSSIFPRSRRTKAGSLPPRSPPRPPAGRRLLGQRELARSLARPRWLRRRQPRPQRGRGKRARPRRLSGGWGEGRGCSRTARLRVRRRLPQAALAPTSIPFPIPRPAAAVPVPVPPLGRARPLAASAARRRGGAAVPAGLWLRRRCCRARTITRAKSSG